MNTNPKVVASSWAALVAAFAVSWIVYAAPGLKDLSEPLQATITAAATGVVAWVAGYLKRHQPPSPPASRGM